MTRSAICGIIAMMAAVLMAGCATTGNPYDATYRISVLHNFKKEHIKTELCALTSFYRFNKPHSDLAVYIEGDGLAWQSRRELSDDPTPRRQLMLSLAVLDPSENVAYLARPGQLTEPERPDCDPSYWSGKRYSREVINAMNFAISRLKAESQAKEIHLIGYSGGAAIAVIIAAERNDIASIRTISGNLDHETVSRYDKVAPLDGSLNPIDFADKVSHIPQRHFASASDKVIPISTTKSFASGMGDKQGESITVVEGTTHSLGWEKAWPSLLRLSLYKGRSAHN